MDNKQLIHYELNKYFNKSSTFSYHDFLQKKGPNFMHFNWLFKNEMIEKYFKYYHHFFYNLNSAIYNGSDFNGNESAHIKKHIYGHSPCRSALKHPGRFLFEIIWTMESDWPATTAFIYKDKVIFFPDSVLSI